MPAPPFFLPAAGAAPPRERAPHPPGGRTAPPGFPAPAFTPPPAPGARGERVPGRFQPPRTERGEAPPAAARPPRAGVRTPVRAEPAPLLLGPSIGFALPARLRERMRGLLGFDPGGARLHTGHAAARAAGRLGAAAFTVGGDVFFAAGRYAPGTRGGLALLAHELAHVRQHPGRPFRPAELTPARRDALEAEARGGEARVLAPRPGPPAARAWPPVAVALAPLAAPAAPLLAAEEGAPAPEPAAAGAAAPAEAPAPAAGAGAEAVAEEVFRLLRERMRIEHERRGIQPWA